MVRICWGQAAFGNCRLLDCLTAKTEALHKAPQSTAVIIKHHSSKSNQSAIKSNSCKWGISGVLGLQWHRSGSKILPTEKEQKLTIGVQRAWIVPCTVFVAEYGRNGTTSSPFCLRSVHYSTTESLAGTFGFALRDRDLVCGHLSWLGKCKWHYVGSCKQFDSQRRKLQC